MNREEDTIIRMRAEGFTTAKIGEVLGISRSATCGRMYRMRARGVVFREAAVKRPDGRSRQSHEPAPMPRDPRVAPPDAEAVNPVGVSVMELQPWHCRAGRKTSFPSTAAPKSVRAAHTVRSTTSFTTE